MRSLEVIHKLGDGGMGQVFLVEDENKQKLALKVITGFSEDRVKLMLESYELMRDLKNSHLAELYETYTYRQSYECTLHLVMVLNIVLLTP